MARENAQITYSPYSKKFYQGAWDRDGTDFMKHLDKLNELTDLET